MSDPNPLNEWRYTCEGRVREVRFGDIDKSGRNPRYRLLIRVAVAGEVTTDPPGVEVAAELAFAGMENEVRKLAGRVPAVGDTVRATGRGSGPRPAQFTLTALAIVATPAGA